jgi:hypothetical protein
MKYSFCTQNDNAYYIEDGDKVVKTAASWFESQVWWHIAVLQQMLQSSFRYNIPSSCYIFPTLSYANSIVFLILWQNYIAIEI